MEKREKLFSISIKGASHDVSGKPMQDYSASYIYPKEKCSIAVVCDGHGADKHFRSEVGSRLATEITVAKLEEFVTLFPSWKSLEGVQTELINRLKISILAGWQKAVEAETKARPFTEEELKKASRSLEWKKDYNVGQPYGTTLLAVLVTEKYYLALMLGDGAIVKILPDQPKHIFEIVEFEGKKVYDDGPHSATDSICESNAFDKIFWKCLPITEREKGLAFGLVSDGMSEAFVTDLDLMKKINNYLEYFAENGLEKAMPPIEAQLHKLSSVSVFKDDISLAFATNHLDLFVVKEEPAGTESAETPTEPEKTEQGAPEQPQRIERQESADPEAPAKEEKAAEPSKEESVAFSKPEGEDGTKQ